MAPARRTTRPAKALLPQDALPVREWLLAAAVELVGVQGLQGFSQARVIAVTGLRQRHLTYYLPSRKDLLKVLAEAVCEFFTLRIGNPLMARLVMARKNAASEDPSLRRWLVGAQLGSSVDNSVSGSRSKPSPRTGSGTSTAPGVTPSRELRRVEACLLARIPGPGGGPAASFHRQSGESRKMAAYGSAAIREKPG